MFRYLLLLAVVGLVAMALLPRIIPVLTWILAFLSLLLLADLVASGIRRMRQRSRS